MIRAGAVAVLAAVVLAGCSSTVQPTPSVAFSAPAAPQSPGAPAGESPAGASAAAGPLEIRGGELAPGTYTHSGFEPRITFDIGEGWQGVQNTSGFFDVQQDPDTPDVIAVQFGNVDGVVGEDGSTVEIGSAAEAVPIIRENPGLTVLGESPSLVSGLEGFTVEVENAANGDVPVLRVTAGPLAISPERRLWVSFFDTPDGVLAVLVGGSVARWEDSLAIAEPVLESVRIGDEAP
jgi:hypothetical protein